MKIEVNRGLSSQRSRINWSNFGSTLTKRIFTFRFHEERQIYIYIYKWSFQDIYKLSYTDMRSSLFKSSWALFHINNSLNLLELSLLAWGARSSSFTSCHRFVYTSSLLSSTQVWELLIHTGVRSSLSTLNQVRSSPSIWFLITREELCPMKS